MSSRNKVPGGSPKLPDAKNNAKLAGKDPKGGVVVSNKGSPGKGASGNRNKEARKSPNAEAHSSPVPKNPLKEPLKTGFGEPLKPFRVNEKDGQPRFVTITR